MIVDVNVGYDLIERVTVSCESPDIAIDMTLGGPGVTAHDQLTEESRNLPDQHPISAITDLSSTLSGLSGSVGSVQSDLNNHKLATNPHNITPAGIGALSVVAHDSSLNGDGTAQSPLKHNPIYAEVTTLADVSVVEITQDINGNPFTFTDGEILEILFRTDNWVGNNNSRLNLSINDITDNVFECGSSIINYIYFYASTAINGQYDVKIINVNNKLYGIIQNGRYTTFLSNVMYSFRALVDIPNVYKLTFTASYGIPAGTKLIVKKY